MTENNTYAQTMIDRSRNDRRILFEKRRPPIFTTTPPLSPDQISFVLSSFVAETIRKCKPLVKGSDFIDEDVIVLRMPEDAHLIPLLEPILFNELLSYKRSTSPEKYTALDTLILTDPHFSDVTSQNVGGETLLTHELRHHIHDDNASTIPTEGLFRTTIPQTDDYIALKFFQEGKKIHFVGYNISDPSMYPLSNVDSELGPNYPAVNDAYQAVRKFTSFPYPFADKIQAWIELSRIMIGKSKKLTSQ